MGLNRFGFWTSCFDAIMEVVGVGGLDKTRLINCFVRRFVWKAYPKWR